MSDHSKARELELLPCSFKFHNFLTEVSDLQISCQVIEMENSLYIWIGRFADNAMNDLSLAILSNYDNIPISTKLLGSTVDATSTNMAKRLAKKLGKPIYVSYNIPAGNLLMPAIERKIQQELNKILSLLSD